jgi:hypothetical protein
MTEKEPINENKEPGKNNNLKEFFSLDELFGYFFRGKDPSRPRNFSLKMMHGINKISIAIFIIAFIFWLFKRLF